MQFTNENFFYNSERSFIFSYVPKVACSNWKCILRYLEGYENYLDTDFAHQEAVNGLRYLKNEEAPYSLLRDPNIKKITCVRNPFSRCLSAYLNKIENNLSRIPEYYEPEELLHQDFFLYIATDIDAFMRSRDRYADKSRVDFGVFVDWLKEGPDWLTQNEHWRSQVELTLVDQVAYDYIGRFESLASDSRHILQMMQCDIDFPTQSDIGFAPMSAGKKISTYYDEDIATSVAEIYSEDFAKFGYERELVLVK